MLEKIISLVIQLIIILTVFPLNLCLNITELTVPSVVMAPEKAVLACTVQDNTENDTFIYIHWYKLVDNEWKLIKIYPPVSAQPLGADTPKGEGEGTGEAPKETTEGATKPPTGETTVAPAEEKSKEDPTKSPADQTTEVPGGTTKDKTKQGKLKIYQLIGMTSNDESKDIEFPQTTLSSAGLYKCRVKSSKETKEMTAEIRVIQKPEDGSKPILNVTKLNMNHIHVICEAPASYPMMALTFFINYESAPNMEVHRLDSIKQFRNITIGETVVADELPKTVEELRIRATEKYVLNQNIAIVCSATLADIYHESIKIDIPFNGSLYSDKYQSVAIIILIVIAIIVSIVAIVAIVWVILRKKKLNSLNKVAELFNKQKNITVLVDNNTNDVKVE